jgi:hypothetical protein
MEELEKINQVEKVLVDTKELMKTIDEMYYKKQFNKLEEFKSIEEADKKFRKCRFLLIRNLEKLKKYLDLNFNLFLALQLHLTVMLNEMQKLENIDETEERIMRLKIEDDSTTEELEDSEDDEIAEAVKSIL